MAEYIIDTNVPRIAQDNQHMSVECSQACSDFMVEVMLGKHTLVLDNQEHILTEYRRHFTASTQATIGNRFLIWYFNNRSDGSRVKEVPITHLGEGDYSEVPQAVVDCGFDVSDRKWVAVAVANKRLAPIVQVADSKWIGWLPNLVAENIQVKFLCKAELAKIHERKTKNGAKSKKK